MNIHQVLLPVIAILREQGLRVHHYLDDILLLAVNRDSLLLHQSILTTTLQKFGWIINWGKSILQPTQRMIFLGVELDNRLNTNRTPSGENSQSNPKDKEATCIYHTSSQRVPQHIGIILRNHPDGTMGSMEHKTSSNIPSKTVERGVISQPITIQKEVKQSLW